jgi:cell division protein FtsL
VVSATIGLTIILVGMALVLVFCYRYIVAANLVFAGYTTKSQLTEKAKLLSKDKTLSQDWIKRAKVILSISRQLDIKEKHYGKHEAIDKIRKELHDAVTGIVGYSMMLHGGHVEIVKTEVDAILSAYEELAA